MSTRKESAKAATVAATKAEAELRKAAVDALRRAGLPKDQIERTKTLPGTPFEHREAFAKLSDADRLTLRKAFKAFADFPVVEFDKLTGAGAGEGGDGKQGRPLEWEDPEPWPKPVDGAELLDVLVALLERYASLPDGGAVAVALWALYTWCFRAFAVAPNLMITAPERESGKTRVTELLSWMVPRAKPVSDASAAAIIRGIERDGPTLLFDEAQHFLNRRPDDPIRGILLAGFTKRFATVERCEGDAHEVRVFSTFCPKAMNGRKLATIDDMLTSRSVVIPMMRARKPLPELRADRDPVGEDIRCQCARWRDDHRSALREANPDVGARIGRVAQVWRPLLAIADEAGGQWPKKARAAANALATVSGTFADGETLGTMLLADVHAVFEAKGNPERIKSKDLDEALRALPERPWESMPQTGKAITASARGQMLANYGVTAETLRFDDGRDAKGYKRAAFMEAWTAYLPEGGGDRTVDPLTYLETRSFGDPRPVDGDRGVNGSGSKENPPKQGVSTGQRFGNRGAGRKDAPEPLRGPPALPSQPPGTPTAGEAYRSLGERQRARDEAIAQWERISPGFARRRAARLAREKAHEAAPTDVASSPKPLGNKGCSDPAHGDDEAGGRT